jgi:hypothetical protein
MKKLYLFFLVSCVTASFSAFSQSTDLYITIGALGTTYQNIENAGEYTAQVGAEAGLGVRIGDRFWVQPGVYYQRTSQEYSPTNLPQGEVTLDRSQLHVPIAFGFSLIQFDPLDIHLYAGPSGTILLSHNSIAGISKEDFKDASLGINVGVGVDVWILSLDVYADFGVTSAFRTMSNDGRLSTFGIRAGLKL